MRRLIDSYLIDLQLYSRDLIILTKFILPMLHLSLFLDHTRFHTLLPLVCP